MNGSDRGQQCRGRRVLDQKPLAPISSASNTYSSCSNLPNRYRTVEVAE
jgi:hypothetical protein